MTSEAGYQRWCRGQVQCRCTYQHSASPATFNFPLARPENRTFDRGQCRYAEGKPLVSKKKFGSKRKTEAWRMAGLWAAEFRSREEIPDDFRDSWWPVACIRAALI